jgi:hypothetical protein
MKHGELWTELIRLALITKRNMTYGKEALSVISLTEEIS